MNITKRQINSQFARAKRLGWLDHFAEAAETITKGFFDQADLLAIASRETNLDPKWLTKAGDHGNGFGLMQADKRSFPEFTKGDDWKDAKKGIIFGAKVLMQKWHDYEGSIGERRTVHSSRSGKAYSYVGEKASGTTAQKLVISSYNCGRWSQYAYANGQDLDKYSTGHDYAADVMERAKVFRSLLDPKPVADNKPAKPAETTPETQPSEPQTSQPSGTDAPTQIVGVSIEPPPETPDQSGQVAPVNETKPQGVFNKLTGGITALFSGTLLYSVLERLGTLSLSQTALILLIVVIVIAFLGFCFWAALDAWKANNRVRYEAESKTDPKKKDIVWIENK